MISRRSVLGYGIAFGATSWLPRTAFAADWSATLAQAKKEGRASLYSSGIAREEEPAMAAFSKESGIAVDYSRPGGGEIVVRKYEQEIVGGARSADVLSLSDYALGLYAHGKGWAATPDLPNAAKLGKAFPVKAPGVFPIGGAGMIIVANTNLVQAADMPKRYADLVNPKYKDKMLFGAPENAGTTTLLIKGLVEQHGWDFVRGLRANNASEMRLQAEAMQAVARGEKAICVVAQPWGYLYQQQGAPIRLIFPEDGTVLARGCLLVTKNAANPAAATVLANHLLSAEFQKLAAENSGNYASNADVAPPKGLPPLAELKIYEPNLEELTAKRGEIIDNWRKIMG